MFQQIKKLTPLPLKRVLKRLLSGVASNGAPRTEALETVDLPSLEGDCPDIVPIPQCKSYAPIYPLNFDAALDSAVLGYEALSNPLSHVAILCDLLESNGYQISSLKHFNEAPKNRKIAALRHDIDAHPPTAVKMAKIYASLGVPASFYILHSAPYYLQVHDDKIFRNPLLEEWVTQIALYGCEVGLHNDALGFSQKLETSASDMLHEELGYLRGLGLTITGSVAHNSFPVHGAENFEVFSELQTFNPELYDPKVVNEINISRKKFQIGAVSMKELGLEYEGNFSKAPIHRNSDDLLSIAFSGDAGIQSSQWMATYLNKNPSIEHDYDTDIWLVGRNSWIISDRKNGIFEHKCGFKTVKSYLETQNSETRLVVTLHPEYFISDDLPPETSLTLT